MKPPWRKACLGLLGCALLAGCTDAPEQANKDRVRSYLLALLVNEAWSDWALYFHPSATVNGSNFALQIMRGTANGLHFSISDLELEIGEQVAEGDWVATRFTLRGIHERPFNAQPATHRPVAFDGYAIDRFDEGRVVESRMLLDIWGLSQRAAAGAAH